VSFDALINALQEYAKQHPEFLNPNLIVNPPPKPGLSKQEGEAAAQAGVKPKRGRPGGPSSKSGKGVLAVGGGASIPSNYVIPDADPWPMSCRSLPLGMCLAQITTRGAYLDPNVIAAQMARQRKLAGGGNSNNAGYGSSSIGGQQESMQRRMRELAGNEVTPEEVEEAIAERESRLKKAGFAVKNQKKGEDNTSSKRFDRLLLALEIYSQVVVTALVDRFGADFGEWCQQSFLFEQSLQKPKISFWHLILICVHP